MDPLLLSLVFLFVAFFVSIYLSIVVRKKMLQPYRKVYKTHDGHTKTRETKMVVSPTLYVKRKDRIWYRECKDSKLGGWLFGNKNTGKYGFKRLPNIETICMKCVVDGCKRSVCKRLPYCTTHLAIVAKLAIDRDDHLISLEDVQNDKVLFASHVQHIAHPQMFEKGIGTNLASEFRVYAKIEWLDATQIRSLLAHIKHENDDRYVNCEVIEEEQQQNNNVRKYNLKAILPIQASTPLTIDHYAIYKQVPDMHMQNGMVIELPAELQPYLTAVCRHEHRRVDKNRIVDVDVPT
jgi:hypothetical protein